MTSSTGALRGLLRDRYPPPDWVLAFEVQALSETGVRYADAIAYKVGAAGPPTLHGFELKVSRGDLLHEVADPEKHKAAAGLCDYWWLVLGSPDLLDDQWLVPSTWGILAPDPVTGALSVRRPASRHLPNGAPPALDRRFLAGVLRRFVSEDYSPEAYWRGQVAAAERKGIAKGRNMAARTLRARDRAGPRWNDKEPLDTP